MAMRALHRIILEEAVIGAVFLTGVWYAYFLVSVWGTLDYLEEGAFKSYVAGPAIHIEMLVFNATYQRMVEDIALPRGLILDTHHRRQCAARARTGSLR